MHKYEFYRKKNVPGIPWAPQYARLNVGTAQELRIGDWIEMDENDNIRVVGHSDITERCEGISRCTFDYDENKTYNIRPFFRSAFIYKIELNGKVEQVTTSCHPLVWLKDNKPDLGDAWLVGGFHRTCSGTPYNAVYVKDGRVAGLDATEDPIIFGLMLMRPRKPSFWDVLRKRVKELMQ